MGEASDVLEALQPVSFQYKPEIDPSGVSQLCLVAEEVEKVAPQVAPQLVPHDQQGKPYTVRYEAVKAMLLNEFLKAHKRVQEQAATIAEMKSTFAKQASTIDEQQKEIAALATAVEAQAAQIKKVGDQLKTQSAGLSVVADNSQPR